MSLSTPNYEWALYVSNNKDLDEAVGNDRPRFRRMQSAWWETGSAYNTLDAIDGTPNRLFQRWIQHPSFDKYWQQMAPYEAEFAKIDIPVLTIDGYYNDSQNSSLYYLREHFKYHADARHYLIIGPYNHMGAQRQGDKVVNEYTVDEHALINTKDITYQWLDHILKGGPLPSKLKDRINYQVMGANEWRSAPSIDAMSNQHLTFYLTQQRRGEFLSLHPEQPKQLEAHVETVDFADRTVSHNDYYPHPIIDDEINTQNGFYFITEPFSEPLIVNGSFSGELNFSINKQDVDIGVTLYEVLPDGRYFHLSYFIGRASYAKDITTRELLTPGKIEQLPFHNTHLVSKQLKAGSRLLVSINVNKNAFSKLNYGTGKDVSTETIKDARKPLEIHWYNNSVIRVPVWIESATQ